MPRWDAFHYIKFHKPFEVLCQFSPSPPKLTLKDFIPIPDVYPAGRLDYRSEGLLLLTDDALVQHRLSDPHYHHSKTYLVQVEGIITESAVVFLRQIDSLAGEALRPVQVEMVNDPQLQPRSKPVRDYHPTSWLSMTLQEGKKHQVRRMTAAAGYPTLRLVRVSIGSLLLDKLEPGQWRHLSKNELARLYLQLGLSASGEPA